MNKNAHRHTHQTNEQMVCGRVKNTVDQFMNNERNKKFFSNQINTNTHHKDWYDGNDKKRHTNMDRIRNVSFYILSREYIWLCVCVCTG